ncbi:MAG: nucleotidyltransferase domain-containing protein [Candidatus Bathyarchaeia archaeon]
MNADSSEKRHRVAREAAVLLYAGLEKEYRQAKLKAAANLSTHVLPSNLEVALELDRLAEENEGAARTERLVQMRREALNIMRTLKAFCPVLIGSVWRGTIRRGSDIDIAVYHDEPDEVVALLKAGGVEVLRTERVAADKDGKAEFSVHVYAETKAKDAVEVVVRSAGEAGRKRRCAIFGDEIKGLKLQELERVLRENPAARFLPK